MTDNFLDHINPGEFCALSSSSVFQKFLQAVDAKLHKSLLDHLAKAEGCNANAKKMISILTGIWKSKLNRERLINFLRINYPLVLVGPVDHNLQNSAGIFARYDPSLNTIPRRLILGPADAARQRKPLATIVDEFCGRQSYCDQIEVNGKVYIEYLPPELGSLKDEIPLKNWQIAAYRTKIGR